MFTVCCVLCLIIIMWYVSFACIVSGRSAFDVQSLDVCGYVWKDSGTGRLSSSAWLRHLSYLLECSSVSCRDSLCPSGCVCGGWGGGGVGPDISISPCHASLPYRKKTNLDIVIPSPLYPPLLLDAVVMWTVSTMTGRRAVLVFFGKIVMSDLVFATPRFFSVSIMQQCIPRTRETGYCSCDRHGSIDGVDKLSHIAALSRDLELVVLAPKLSTMCQPWCKALV